MLLYKANRHKMKKVVAKMLWTSGWYSKENAVVSIRKKLGFLHFGVEKKKYDVIALANIKSAWYGVFQYCDNDVMGPLPIIKMIGVIATNPITHIRTKNSNVPPITYLI